MVWGSGGNLGYFRQAPWNHGKSFTLATTSTVRGIPDSFLWTEVVPAKLSLAPPQAAKLRWPRFQPGLNDTMMTGQMALRPVVRWDRDSSALHTVIIVDEGIESLEGKQFIHWMVTNIPGINVELGAEVMEYTEPFSVTVSSDGVSTPMASGTPCWCWFTSSHQRLRWRKFSVAAPHQFSLGGSTIRMPWLQSTT